MGFQEELMELMKKYDKGDNPAPAVDEQKDAVPPPEDGETKSEEAPPAPGEKAPNEEADKGTSNFDATPKEKAEFDTPTDEPKNVVKTPGDMLAEQMEMRFSSFYQTQQEFEATLKLALQEIADLKRLFSKIETAIDVAADSSPQGARIEEIVNIL